MTDDILENVKPSPQTLSITAGRSLEKHETSAEHRKSSKPIMEKRRRARINNSLCQLKTLILDALKKDSSRHSKLEKADILEMTVKHLRNVQMAAPHPALEKYGAGYSACMNEVTRFMSTCEGMSVELRARLLAHLATRVPQVSAVMTSAPQQPRDTTFKGSALEAPCRGFRLVPTAHGTLTLLLPGPHAVMQRSPGTRDSVWRPW